MSQFKTSLLTSHEHTAGYVQPIVHRPNPERPLAFHRLASLSPERASYAQYQGQAKYNFRTREERIIPNYYDLQALKKTNGYRLPQRRNGYVYEDIYSKQAWCSEYKTKFDYSSPYKPIKPEYLTLPSSYNKYSTLPKSWSISSHSNSYKNHFAPIRSTLELKQQTLSYGGDYRRRESEYSNINRAPRSLKEQFFSSEERSSLYLGGRIYGGPDTSLCQYPGKQYSEEQPPPRPPLPASHNTSDKLQPVPRPRRLKQQQRPDKQEEFFQHALEKDKNPPKQRNTSTTHANENTAKHRRSEYETKKNVTFSEVSGCEERNNVVGVNMPRGQMVFVRELEVAFSQVADTTGIVKDGRDYFRPHFKQNSGSNGKNLPNGHCISDRGSGIVPKYCNPGKLPTKPGQTNPGFIAGFAKRKYLSQVVAALAVSLAPFAAGLGKGYSSPAIASLQHLKLRRAYNATAHIEITVTDQQVSWVASLSLLGAVFGGVMGGIAMRHGRRKVLLMTSLPFSLSWILTAFATSVEMMFFTSFMGGFCCSIVLMVSQVYVSEISVPDIRGCLNAVLKIVGHIGTLMAFTMGAYLDWQQLAMLISIAPIILFCTMIYIPETPSFLVLCGKEEEAYKSLVWLRGPGTDILKELATIRANVIATKNFNNQNLQTAGSTALNALFTPRYATPVLITCGLMFFQRFSGAHAFTFYAVPIFRKTFEGMNPHGAAVAVGFVQLLASCLSGLLIDSVGRLPLLIASSVFMSMALAGFGSFSYYTEVHKKERLQNILLSQSLGLAGQNDWIPLLFVLVFTVAFSLGMNPISWLLIGELFPLEFRGSGSALATAFSHLCAFINVKTFVDFQEWLGMYGAFWFYAFVSVVGLCFVVCCVPETRGKDLDEMNPKFVQSLSPPFVKSTLKR